MKLDIYSNEKKIGVCAYVECARPTTAVRRLRKAVEASKKMDNKEKALVLEWLEDEEIFMETLNGATHSDAGKDGFYAWAIELESVDEGYWYISVSVKKEAGIKKAEEAWEKEEATKEEAPREEEEEEEAEKEEATKEEKEELENVNVVENYSNGYHFYQVYAYTWRNKKEKGNVVVMQGDKEKIVKWLKERGIDTNKFPVLNDEEGENITPSAKLEIESNTHGIKARSYINCKDGITAVRSFKKAVIASNELSRQERFLLLQWVGDEDIFMDVLGDYEHAYAVDHGWGLDLIEINKGRWFISVYVRKNIEQ